MATPKSNATPSIVDEKALEQSQKNLDFVQGNEKDIIGEQSNVSISKEPVMDMKTFMKMAEETGMVFLKKDELDFMQEQSRQFQKMINEGVLANANKAVTDNAAKTKVTYVATQSDLDFYESVMKEPKVNLPIMIQRISDGSSMEHKRPKMTADGKYMKTKEGKAVFENYIPVSINGFSFDTSLGVDQGKNVTPVVIASNVPLSVAIVIAEARKQAFQLPNGEMYTPYSLVGMEQAPLNVVTDGQITQSECISDKYKG